MTEITQADRDMAARIFGAFGIHGEKIVKAGWADDDDIVKAFARHRMEERAAIVAWLRGKADEYDSGHRESWPTIDSFNQTADAIIAGKHLK